VLTEYFPRHLAGRVNTTLTLVMFMLVFVFQIGVGALLNCWPSQGGHYPAVAHLSAWGILVALQVIAAVWYFMPARTAGEAAHGAA
jgi:predicted tellurium resistance membrane protein TerC